MNALPGLGPRDAVDVRPDEWHLCRVFKDSDGRIRVYVEDDDGGAVCYLSSTQAKVVAEALIGVSQ